MKSPGRSVGAVMAIIAVVAIDLVAVRSLFPSYLLVLVGTMPMGLAVQAGAVARMQTRRRWRKFWAGFVIWGSAAAVAVGVGLAFQDWWLNRLLYRYIIASSDALRYFVPITGRLFHDRVYLTVQGIPLRLGALAEYALLYSLPQLLAACLGGWADSPARRPPGRNGYPHDPWRSAGSASLAYAKPL